MYESPQCRTNRNNKNQRNLTSRGTNTARNKIELSDDLITGKAYRRNASGRWDVLGKWRLPTT